MNVIFFYLDKKDEEGALDLKLTTGGRPLMVTLSQRKEEKKIFDFQAGLKLQTERHFSENDMRLISLYNYFLSIYNSRAIEKTNREVFGKHSVQKGTRDMRTARNHMLDDFFTARSLNLKLKPKKTDENYEDCDLDLDCDGLLDIVRPAVVCHDPNSLINKVNS